MERSRHGRTTPSRTITAAEQEGRPKQRAFCVAALEEGEDLSELRELLRTAGVAVVGQTVQILVTAPCRPYGRIGQS
jgi:GTP-binding protein HflX